MRIGGFLLGRLRHARDGATLTLPGALDKEGLKAVLCTLCTLCTLCSWCSPLSVQALEGVHSDFLLFARAVGSLPAELQGQPGALTLSTHLSLLFSIVARVRQREGASLERKDGLSRTAGILVHGLKTAQLLCWLPGCLPACLPGCVPATQLAVGSLVAQATAT